MVCSEANCLTSGCKSRRRRVQYGAVVISGSQRGNLGRFQDCCRLSHRGERRGKTPSPVGRVPCRGRQHDTSHQQTEQRDRELEKVFSSKGAVPKARDNAAADRAGQQKRIKATFFVTFVRFC